MARLLPFSRVTKERLQAGPEEGGTHRWLPQVASGLRGTLNQEQAYRFLRRCCDELVGHREVPDREVAAAVRFAYGRGGQSSESGSRRKMPKWPEANAEAIERVIARVDPLFDGETSTGCKPADVLPALFEPGELVCTGRDSRSAMVRPLDAVIEDAALLQFIVVNPMKGVIATNQEGNPSARCQNNVRARRHIVAEFDDPALTKRMQAQVASALGQSAPLVLAVDSGGKSVHAWYRVDGMTDREQGRFFAAACALGADATRWDTCGWLRMPGGLRVVNEVPQKRQRILYFKG